MAVRGFVRPLGISVILGLASLAGTAVGAGTPVLGGLGTGAEWRVTQPGLPITLNDISERVWTQAHAGKSEEILASLRSLPAGAGGQWAGKLRGWGDELQASISKREAKRAEEIGKARTELKTQLEGEQTPAKLSKALKAAVELHMLAVDKEAFLSEAATQRLIDAATSAGRDAESKGDWLMASELFFRLHALLEEEGRFKADTDRLADRLNKLRLYVPQRLWELRNKQAIADGDKPLPAFNALGEDFNRKLAAINEEMVLRAISISAERHVYNTDEERMIAGRRVSLMGPMLVGGLESIKTLATTQDLQAVFPGLGDTEARNEMVKFIDEQQKSLQSRASGVGPVLASTMMQSLLEVNRRTVKLPDNCVLHEFGNGAMATLDDFSAIIWPDEKPRFERMTQGEFKGVGIHIELDKESQAIRVVTPLDDTPAQKAGVHRDDLIVKIDGQSAIGLSLNQAVDLITGPAGSPVTITVKRTEKGANDEQVDREIDFALKRQIIPIATVKGWKREGVREDAWNWYIDHENKIGYIRLLQFTEDTTDDLAAAIGHMKEQGLNGLILDLRFNPGGLLTQAVSVANAFIDRGLIVSTQGTTPSEKQSANPRHLLMDGIPMAVLINEGSASASEIVSGAIRHYADNGSLRAVIVGARSFGKGSVQNVWQLNAQASALLKVTTQYYYLPNGETIHRKPGAHEWGVSAHINVEMLPDQIVEALRIRQDADIIPIDEKGPMANMKPPPDPNQLLTDGIDLQLQTALIVLRSQAASKIAGHVRVDGKQ